MHGTVFVQGHQFVAPLTDLIMPLQEYFPCGIDTWVYLDEHERKELILERDGHVCQISGEHGEVHEIIARGGAGLMALAPWNMITITRANHNLQHAGKSKILKFDPLDMKDGLHVEMNDRQMQKNRMYFYSTTPPGAVNLAFKYREMLESFVKASVANLWVAAKAISWLKDNDGHTLLGSSSFNSMMAEMGLSTAFADPLRRTYSKAKELGVLEHALDLHPDRAGKIIRQVEPEKVDEVLTEAKGLPSKRDFDKLLDENKKPRTQSNRKYFVINGSDKKLVEAPNIQGIVGDIIVDGTVKRDVNNEVKE